MKRIEQIEKQALAELGAAGTVDAIDAIRVCYLGRKGILTGVMRNISQLPKEDRPSAGKKANQVKGVLENAVKEAMAGEINRILAEPEEDRLLTRAQAMDRLGIRTRDTMLKLEKGGDLRQARGVPD